MHNNIKFIKSGSADPKSWPLLNIKEICFVGRSNVGKSSLINAIFNQKIAKVANRPGKTLLLNFFSVNNDKWILTDTPGYGYAKISKIQQNQVSDMMTNYFELRKQLEVVAIVIDIRRAITDLDKALLNLFSNVRPQLKILFFLTKIDKISYSKQIVSKKKIEKQLSEYNDLFADKFKLMLVSSRTKKNVNQAIELLNSITS